MFVAQALLSKFISFWMGVFVDAVDDCVLIMQMGGREGELDDMVHW